MVNLRTMEIIATAFGNGSIHDFRLFKEIYTGMASDILCLADTGYLDTCQEIEVTSTYVGAESIKSRTVRSTDFL